MKNVKIIFFDVDGTLRPYDGHVLASTKLAFKQLKEKRILTCIASGRGYKSLDEEIRSLAADYFITATGQYAQSASGEEIYSQPIPAIVVESFVNWAKQEQIELVFVGAKETAITRWDSLSRECMTHGYEEVKEDPGFYLRHAVYQILTVSPAGKDLVLPENLVREVYAARWHPYSYDVVLKTGSKGIGVRKVLDYLNIAAADALAFGDGNNDLPMFKVVQTGVAMGNASLELKAAAGLVTDSTYEDGIYNGLVTLKIL